MSELKVVGFYSPEQVAQIFGQGSNGKRWVYRHSDKYGFLYRAVRRHPGTRALLFDRAEIDRIVAAFQAPRE
jgi:hypothetical protein